MFHGTGLGDRVLRGISHYEIFPEIPERWKQVHRLALAGEFQQSEEDRFDRADGSVQWLRWQIRPWFSSGGEIGGIVICTEDITERKRIEEELRIAKARLTEEKLYLEEEIADQGGFGEIIGWDTGLKVVIEKVRSVARTDSTVLLLGETGTGKELIARSIHKQSRRADKPFIKLNCAAIPSGLLESELFGAERGAYTGAVRQRIGRIELADQGTLFLDEIGEISPALQPKLLRVLQEQEFERLGGNRTIKINFRLIAATNRDLLTQATTHQFRSDLYYRLAVFPILLPPLRQRKEDVPELVEHFVAQISRRAGKTITSIPKGTLEALVNWHWPGNVRELENFIERSVILSTGTVLAAPTTELAKSDEPAESPTGTLLSLERQHILKVLKQSNGRISGPHGAAVRLGLKRTTLQSKLKKLGIDASETSAAQSRR